MRAYGCDFHCGAQRSPTRVWRAGVSWCLTLFLAVSAQAAISLRVELPEDAAGKRVFWGVKQNGLLVASGFLDCAAAADPVISTSAPDGAATLWISINQDEYESYYPSFGDRFQRVPFEIRDGDAEVTAQRSAWQRRELSEPGNLLTLHYHRFDGGYRSVGIWTWDEHQKRQPEQQETFEVGRDDYGLVFQIDVGAYGSPGDRIGLLPRMNGSWNFKDGGDRYWAPRMGRRVYLLQDSDGLSVEPPDTAPKLVGARLEEPNEVVARFTHSLPIVDFPARRFTIRDDGGTAWEVATVKPDGKGAAPDSATSFRLTLARPLNMTTHTYELAVLGFSPRRIALGGVLVDVSRFYDADAVLGATYTPEATTFRVFSPVADAVEVVVADTHTGGEVEARPMAVNNHGIWSATIPGDLKGKFYAYRLRGPDLDAGREVTDIYATCTTGPGGRGLILDLADTDPPGFDPEGYVRLDSPVDAVIYEMHVRDLTIAPNSGVQHKGKYLGFTERGTHLPSDASVKTGLDHLVELGVTHVQIMPIQDFDNQETPEDSYNWGYMPLFFNSPDGWYATVPVGPERIREFKRLVQSLHDLGIGVIMDVVYNHTALHASFDRLAPGYYFRLKPDGSYWNGSGCGNEFASEHPMARKYMLDSVKYWVREYGIDGFRFDLMGLHDLETMIEIREELRKINPSVLVYGEPWTGGASGLRKITNQKRVAGTGVAAFNDHFRDAIKGERDGGAPGFIQKGTRIVRIRQGIMGAVGHWATQPTDCLTYCACHDNLTTWDKLLQSAHEAPRELKRRMQRFAGLLVLTSQGISFIHGGQEMCRSKGGSHNSYNLPDSVNQIDWSLKKRNRDVFAYYQGLIALRKAHPCFRLRTGAEVRRRIEFRQDVPAEHCVAYTIDGTGLTGESHAATLVLLNGESTEQTFALPPGNWHLLVDADRAGTDTLAEVEGSVPVKAHSGMVLAR